MIEDYLAETARTLRVQAAELTRRADQLSTAVNRLRAGHCENLFEPAPSTLSRDDRIALLGSLYSRRRVRERYLPRDMFGEPAWDMLLDLYLAELRGKRITLTSLAIAANSPMTTALRWQNLLVEGGLIERVKSKKDGRVAFAQMTDKGREALDAICRELLQRG